MSVGAGLCPCRRLLVVEVELACLPLTAAEHWRRRAVVVVLACPLELRFPRVRRGV